MQQRTALVLSGGGARAAYQVGVLAAIRELRGHVGGNPFPVICGTSAGGINAAALAVFSNNFNRAVRRLQLIWNELRCERVFRTDPLAIYGSVAHWAAAMTLGGLLRRPPRSLLDNAPLARLLEDVLDFDAIGRAIGNGDLYALSITASGYTSGESLAFFEAAPEAMPWRRAQRIGVPARIGVKHLMATSAIPFVFPAVHINREYFGDGSMRQLAPISPAVHLGADRILIVGVGRLAEEGRQRADSYPSPAQIAGHALSSLFLDGLAVDLERLSRTNELVSRIDAERRVALGVGLRPIESLVISPSRRLDAIAGHHRATLPRSLRLVLGSVGAMRRDGSTLLSYLLFEPGFTRALMDLGYQDAMARRQEVADFLRL